MKLWITDGTDNPGTQNVSIKNNMEKLTALPIRRAPPIRGEKKLKITKIKVGHILK
jgi:hypothetical protein